ncbi:hypothetical protein ACRQ4C_01470 [Curtobacterium sp. SP.BCp]|uniref:hypothetical protein n=1 Tax=Curtobacterium sp. SP.BCp TaxID=3435230 RepID=UPI003F737866
MTATPQMHAATSVAEIHADHRRTWSRLITLQHAAAGTSPRIGNGRGQLGG